MTTPETHIILFALEKAGIPLAAGRSTAFPAPVRLHFRKNPDGTIRWVWRAGSRKAHCLRFYHQGSRRSRRFAFVISALFTLGLERLFAQGAIHAHGQKVPDFALFTGTRGANRKMLLFNDGVFSKIALTDTAASLIHREATLLRQFAGAGFRFLRCPILVASSPQRIDIGALSGDHRHASAGIWTTLHEKALDELYRYSAGIQPVGDAEWWRQLSTRLKELDESPDCRLPRGLIRKLHYLAADIPTGQAIPCCRAHGDLTPWNMIHMDGQLGVYDWELSIDKAPVLFDAFHFILQSGVLLHRQPPQTIWRQLTNLRSSDWVGMLEEEGMDFFLQLRCYALINFTYYLHLYSRQPEWHLQVDWLLDTWTQILSRLLMLTGKWTPRQMLCMDVFDRLRDRQYAALKWFDTRPESLPSTADIDLCVSAEADTLLREFLCHHPLVRHCRRRSRSFMTHYTLAFDDGSRLDIDAIRDLRRKQLRMLDANEVLAGAAANPWGVRIPQAKMDFAYTWLFHLLNHASIPIRYQQYFQQLPSLERTSIDSWFLTRWDTGLPHFYHAFACNDPLRRKIISSLRRQSANTPLKIFTNRIGFFADKSLDWLSAGGMVITFSGVDGAGKSTVIEKLRTRLEKQLRRRVIVLRHRPSLLPILSAWKEGRSRAEKAAAVNLPRQGANRNLLSSLFRFAYYFTDYLFGQFYIQLRYVRLGYIVLYDRYYFDFIQDARRSNIHLPPAFTRWFYRLLLKPRFNFLLYAPPAEIRRRKQELDEDTIRQLTGDYRRLFRRLSRRYHRSEYIPLANTHSEQTVDIISRHIKNHTV